MLELFTLKLQTHQKQQNMLSLIKKNPAYGRQSISQPMRIVAPIPKNPASKAKFVKNLTFFARRFKTLYEQKYSNRKQLLFVSFPQGFGKS